MGFLERLFNRYLGGGHYGGHHGDYRRGHGGKKHGGYYRDGGNAGTRCHNCQASNPVDARFCQQCGASLQPSVCQSCGAAMQPGTRYCGRCGADSQK